MEAQQARKRRLEDVLRGALPLQVEASIVDAVRWVDEFEVRGGGPADVDEVGDGSRRPAPPPRRSLRIDAEPRVVEPRVVDGVQGDDEASLRSCVAGLVRRRDEVRASVQRRGFGRSTWEEATSNKTSHRVKEEEKEEEEEEEEDPGEAATQENPKKKNPAFEAFLGPLDDRRGSQDEKKNKAKKRQRTGAFAAYRRLRLGLGETSPSRHHLYQEASAAARNDKKAVEALGRLFRRSAELDVSRCCNDVRTLLHARAQCEEMGLLLPPPPTTLGGLDGATTDPSCVGVLSSSDGGGAATMRLRDVKKPNKKKKKKPAGAAPRRWVFPEAPAARRRLPWSRNLLRLADMLQQSTLPLEENMRPLACEVAAALADCAGGDRRAKGRARAFLGAVERHVTIAAALRGGEDNTGGDLLEKKKKNNNNNNYNYTYIKKKTTTTPTKRGDDEEEAPFFCPAEWVAAVLYLLDDATAESAEEAFFGSSDASAPLRVPLAPARGGQFKSTGSDAAQRKGREVNLVATVLEAAAALHETKAAADDAPRDDDDDDPNHAPPTTLLCALCGGDYDYLNSALISAKRKRREEAAAGPTKKRKLLVVAAEEDDEDDDGMVAHDYCADILNIFRHQIKKSATLAAGPPRPAAAGPKKRPLASAGGRHFWTLAKHAAALVVQIRASVGPSDGAFETSKEAALLEARTPNKKNRRRSTTINEKWVVYDTMPAIARVLAYLGKAENVEAAAAVRGAFPDAARLVDAAALRRPTAADVWQALGDLPSGPKERTPPRFQGAVLVRGRRLLWAATAAAKRSADDEDPFSSSRVSCRSPSGDHLKVDADVDEDNLLNKSDAALCAQRRLHEHFDL